MLSHLGLIFDEKHIFLGLNRRIEYFKEVCKNAMTPYLAQIFENLIFDSSNEEKKSSSNPSNSLRMWHSTPFPNMKVFLCLCSVKY